MALVVLVEEAGGAMDFSACAHAIGHVIQLRRKKAENKAIIFKTVLHKLLILIV